MSAVAAATHVFVAADVLDADGVIVVDSDTEHHLSRVLRLRAGERVSVSDGAGRWRIAVIVDGGSGLTLEPVLAVVTTQRAHPVLTHRDRDPQR